MITKNQEQNALKRMFFIALTASIAITGACNKSVEEEAVEAQRMTMSEVDTPPLFGNCAEGASRAEAQQCFNQGLMHHLLTSIIYPETAYNAGAEAKVFISITIDAFGKVLSPEVLKTDILPEHAAYQEALELAALEVFASFPKLRPAQKDGKDVAISYVVPINFKLPPKRDIESIEQNEEQAVGPQEQTFTVRSKDKC